MVYNNAIVCDYEYNSTSCVLRFFTVYFTDQLKCKTEFKSRLRHLLVNVYERKFPSFLLNINIATLYIVVGSKRNINSE